MGARAWTGLGLLGSVLVAIAGPRLIHHAWWYHLALSHLVADLALYLGIALVCVAWIGLGRCLSDVSGRRLWAIGLLWALPALLGPPLFSRDVYSYLADGELLHLGLDPYGDAPHVLLAHGQVHVLAAVSPFWRHTTAPYGPLFLGIVSLVAAVAGSHVTIAALAIKVIDASGLVLLGVFVPRIAVTLRCDPRRAAWLAVLSPLVLLQVIAAGHNDGLMAGLMVAGVALALERRTIPGVALCALAAMIKLPALAACVFIVVAAMRAEPDRDARLRVLLRAALAFVAALVVVSAATTIGTDWLTTGVFSSPTRLRLALTPSTGLGYTVASVLHDLGLSAHARPIESALAVAAALLVAVLALALLVRTSRRTLVRDIAIVMLAAALGGPAAWPWYLIWGLGLLAAWPAAQRSVWIVVAVTVPAFLIRPGGTALPPREWSPLVVCVYALLALMAWRAWRRREPHRPVLAPT
jgi:alpha-1,6-mannosyltransferase